MANRGEGWYLVEADYSGGGNYTFVGEANDRIGYLALGDRAYADGAKNVRVLWCESVGGVESQTNLFGEKG